MTTLLAGMTGFQTALIGTSVAGTLFDIADKNDQYESQLKAQKDQMEANALNTYNQSLAIRQNQAIERERLARERLQGQFQGLKEKGSAIAAQGSSGVYGVSADDALAQFDQSLSNYNESTSRQMKLSDYSSDINSSNVYETGKATHIGLNRHLKFSGAGSLLGGLASAGAMAYGFHSDNLRGLQDKKIK